MQDQPAALSGSRDGHCRAGRAASSAFRSGAETPVMPRSRPPQSHRTAAAIARRVRSGVQLRLHFLRRDTLTQPKPVAPRSVRAVKPSGLAPNMERRTSTPSHTSAAFSIWVRYDNLASAVRKILRGYRREETVRFLAFRSHWRFAEFCTPGEGHEKGGIEGEGGYFRRNHLVPVPRVADLDALNTMLLTACRADEARILDGRSDTVGAAMAIERGHLPSCPTEGVELAETVFALVDKQGCVTVKTNFYSVLVETGWMGNPEAPT